jgi:glycosyltransferase involved in cell wall biosynthesis
MSDKTLIVIPTFNAEAFLERTLRSILLPGNTALVCVVDNCSDDNTAWIAKQYSERHPNMAYRRNETNLGRIGNWNRCLELVLDTEYKYLKFLFAGDELLPYCIEKMEQEFAGHPDVGIISSAYIIRDTDTTETTQRLMKNTQELDSVAALLHSALVSSWWASPTVYMVRTACISDIRFSPDFPWAADWKFAIDIAAGAGSFWLADPLSVFNMDSRRNFLASGQRVESQLENCLMKFYSLNKIKDRLAPDVYEAHYQQIRDDCLTHLVRAREIPEILRRKFINRLS